MFNRVEKSPPIIAHLIYRLDIGGLERVMLNCINQMQDQVFEHIIISLTEANNFAQSLENPIKVYCLHKRPGADLIIHYKLYKLLKQIKPGVLHTYNLPTIEYHPIAKLAGVQGHIHAEHGRDIGDPQGLNKKHNLLRRSMALFINTYISVSEDLHVWLANTVGVANSKNVLIQNGVNTVQFNREKTAHDRLRLTIVSRISAVKDHQNLLQAMQILKAQLPIDALPELAIVGEGELRAELEQYCLQHCLSNVTFLGARNDISTVLSQTDIFVLSSIAEGIPMTILEAMSASTPVVATNVGGISEVIENAKQGFLVQKSDPNALAQAIQHYIKQPALIVEHGNNARQKVLDKFDERIMVQAYVREYKALFKGQY